MQCRVEHFGLPAHDPAKLKDWYLQVLGGALVFENPPAYYVKLDETFIVEIYASSTRNPGVSQNGLAGWRHLALRVENIEASKAFLESKGVQFKDPIRPAGGGGRVLFFEDLEGNLLHLVERTPDSVFR